MKTTVFNVEADPTHNLLRVRFRGVITGARLAADSQQIPEALQQLRAGFVALVDLTEMESMDLDCLPMVTRMMDLHLAAEIGRVVRVIPDPSKDIGFNILSITHYHDRVPIITCRTRAEAESALGGA